MADARSGARGRTAGQWMLASLLVLNLIVLARGVLAFAVHSFVRVIEPSAIQWLEPIFFRSALRVFENLPLYGPPTSEYVSGMYTPLPDLVNGAVLRIFGVAYPPLRVVSFLAFVALLALLFRWIQRETRSAVQAAICVGLALTISGQMRHWFSSVNIDAAYLLWGLAGFYLLYHQPGSRRATAASALCLAASFLCKPQGFVLAAAAFAFVLLHESRALALLFAAVCASVAGLVSLVYLAASDGWYWTSMVTVPFEYPSKPDAKFLRGLWKTSRLGTLSFFLLLPWLARLLARPRVRRRATLLLLLSSAMLALSYLSFNKAGGDYNSLAPTLFLGMLGFGLLPALSSGGGGPGPVPLRLMWLCIAAFVLYTGFPRSLHAARHLLEAPSFSAGRAKLFQPHRAFELRLTGAMAEAENPFVGARPRLQYALGKPLTTHQTPLYNLTVRTKLNGVRDIFGDGIERHEFDRILLWEYPASPLTREVQEHYERAGELGNDPLLRQLRVAWWRPRRPAAPPRTGLVDE